MPEISVILPVYNGAETLPHTLRALSGQAFKDFEVLLCDDGSTDGSAAICARFCRADSRARLLQLHHHGVSSARNAGLDQAAGTYIAFLDCDDLPEPDWLSTLAQCAQPDGLGVCGYRVAGPDGAQLYGTGDLSVTRAVFTPRQFITVLFSNQLLYQGYVWNKLFSARLIGTGRPLRFAPHLSCNEDRHFLFWYLRRCGPVNYWGRECYRYRRRTSAPAYTPELLTELDAFEDMCRNLARTGPPEAAFYAEKDRFRAAAELYVMAWRQGGTPAQLRRLGAQVLDGRHYADQFGDYPVQIQAQMHWAVADALARRAGASNDIWRD